MYRSVYKERERKMDRIRSYSGERGEDRKRVRKKEGRKRGLQV